MDALVCLVNPEKTGDPFFNKLNDHARCPSRQSLQYKRSIKMTNFSLLDDFCMAERGCSGLSHN
jgi:hypothetical protein